MILQSYSLVGKITAQGCLSASINAVGSIIGTVNTTVYGDYIGEYEVSPKFEAQTLQTKKLAMRDDVKIKEIVITKTSNIGGGKTVIIGG